MSRRFIVCALLLAAFGTMGTTVLLHLTTLHSVEPQDGNLRQSEVKVGQFVKEVFHLHNPNYFTVHVSVPPQEGCACLTAEPKEADIPSGASTAIQLTIDPAGKKPLTKAVRVLTQRGKQTKEAWLYVTYFNKQ